MTELSLASFPSDAYDAWLALEIERRASMLLAPMSGDAAYARERSAALMAKTMPDGAATETCPLLAVEADGRRVGWVWFSRQQGTDAIVLDAVLDPATDPLALASVVEAQVSAWGGSHLVLDALGEAGVLAAWAERGGFEDVATNMVLDLTGELPPSRVSLRAVGQDRFDRYLAITIEAYAREIHEASTLTWEEALADSRETHAELLPDGLATPEQHLFDVLDETGVVAFVWIGTERGAHAGYVYDIVVDEDRRGQGLGRATMHAAARWCREQGKVTLGLNVFGPNQVARSLYDSLGYRVVQRELKRPLDRPVTTP